MRTFSCSLFLTKIMCRTIQRVCGVTTIYKTQDHSYYTVTTVRCMLFRLQFACCVDLFSVAALSCWSYVLCWFFSIHDTSSSQLLKLEQDKAEDKLETLALSCSCSCSKKSKEEEGGGRGKEEESPLRPSLRSWQAGEAGVVLHSSDCDRIKQYEDASESESEL